ncbi:MAG: glycosyltransferase [Candidatus Micrarchaeaceae archaeon]
MKSTKTLKIALIIDQPSWTGIGTYAHMLYYLIKDYCDVKFIYLGAHNDNSSIYENLKYVKYAKNPYLIPKIVKYNYRMFKKDIKFKDYIKHYLGAFYPTDLIDEKTIITVHDLIKDNYFLSLKFGIRELATSFIRNRSVKNFKNVLNKKPFIIAISNNTADAILKINKNSKITVIYHWIDKNKFKFRDKSQSKEILGLNENINYLLSVGSSRPNKRLDLIKSFADYLPINWKLIKIGASINSKNVLNYKNIDDEKYPLFFNASEAYLHMSDDEGLGIPLLEALGSGIPIIARKSKINSEVLGDYAIYLEQDNKKYFQENMNNILSTIKILQFKKDELDKLFKKYDLNNAREKYLNFYKQFEHLQS